MILDLLAKKELAGDYEGRVRVAQISKTPGVGYVFHYEHTGLRRTTREEAREDAERLARVIAHNKGLKVIESQMEHSLTAI